MTMLEHMRIKPLCRWLSLPLLVLSCTPGLAAEPARPPDAVIELDHQSEALKRQAIDLAKDVDTWMEQQQSSRRNGRSLIILASGPSAGGYDWRQVRLELGDAGLVDETPLHVDAHSNLILLLRATAAPGTYPLTAQLVDRQNRQVSCTLQVEVKPGAGVQYVELRAAPSTQAPSLQCELNTWQ